MLGKTEILDTNPTGQGVPVPVTQRSLQESAGQRGSRQCGPRGITALAPTLDRSLRSDRSLCPVRALRYYLDRTSGRIMWWFLSPLRKVLTKTSHLPLSPLGSSRLWSYVMSSLTRRPTLYIRLKPMMSGPLMLLRFSSRSFLRYSLVSLPLKSHNTFTHFYLKDGAWADSELYQLGSVVAAQQIHKWPLD